MEYEPNPYIIMQNSITKGESGAWQMLCFKSMDMVLEAREEK